MADANLVFIAETEVLDVPRSRHAVPHLAQPGTPPKAAQTINPGLGCRQTDTRMQNCPLLCSRNPLRWVGEEHWAS